MLAYLRPTSWQVTPIYELLMLETQTHIVESDWSSRCGFWCGCSLIMWLPGKSFMASCSGDQQVHLASMHIPKKQKLRAKPMPVQIEDCVGVGRSDYPTSLSLPHVNATHHASVQMPHGSIAAVFCNLYTHEGRLFLLVSQREILLASSASCCVLNHCSCRPVLSTAWAPA